MTKAKAAVPHRPYHHGDLHRAILSAALKVLRETESTEFSLRSSPAVLASVITPLQALCRKG